MERAYNKGPEVAVHRRVQRRAYRQLPHVKAARVEPMKRYCEHLRPEHVTTQSTKCFDVGIVFRRVSIFRVIGVAVGFRDLRLLSL